MLERGHEQWPRDGVPENPGAWLMATAKHQAIDRLRRREVLERKTAELGRELYDRLATMTAHLDKLGTKLNGAVADYNQTVGSFERRVLPSARKFTDHGITPKKELPELEPVEVTAQLPQTVELPVVKRDAA